MEPSITKESYCYTVHCTCGAEIDIVDLEAVMYVQCGNCDRVLYDVFRQSYQQDVLTWVKNDIQKGMKCQNHADSIIHLGRALKHLEHYNQVPEGMDLVDQYIEPTVEDPQDG